MVASIQLVQNFWIKKPKIKQIKKIRDFFNQEPIFSPYFIKNEKLYSSFIPQGH